MSKKLFIPSKDQKEHVLKCLCRGELAQAVRLQIINPETKKPLDFNIFCDKFAEEILEARATRGSVITSNLYNAAKYVGVNNVTGLEERDVKAMQQWLALDGRGLFGKKFELDCTKCLADQLNQIKQACADGMIGAQEMTAFINAIAVELNLFDVAELKRRLDAIDNGGN